jgi:tetratricopeptide (TPR) repeat protein
MQLKGERVEAFATLDQLRVAYAMRIVSMVERIQQGLETLETDLNEFSSSGWRAFTSNLFAAAQVALSIALPRFTVSFSLPAEEVLERIAVLQAAVWLSLCNSWSFEPEDGHTIDADLEHYMALSAMAPDAMLRAADEFLRWTESLEALPLVAEFCLAAMRASLYSWCQKPNPRLREWADLFVEKEVERRLLGDQAPIHLVAMEISAKRARSTIPYEELFDACLRQLPNHGLKVLPQLGEIGQKMGYSDLSNQLVFALRPLPKNGQRLSVDEFIETLFYYCKDGSLELLLGLASNWLEVLSEPHSFDTLCQVADGLKSILRSDAEIRARIESWLCSNLLRNGLAKAALERIGDEAQPWERELTSHERTSLWTERSNALRKCGRATEALVVAEAVIADLEAGNEAIQPALRRNLGILYREAGRQEEALKIFLELLPNSERDLDLLHSIVVTYSSIGRIAEGIPYLEKMSKLARGPNAERHPTIIATLAGAKAAVGQRHEAFALLRELPLDKADDEFLVAYASAWVTLSLYAEKLEEEDRQNLSSLVTKLKVVHDATLKKGDMQSNMLITRILAWLVDFTQARRNPFWKLLDVRAREFEGAPDPMALLALARDAWVDGHYRKAKKYLMEVPSAIAKRYRIERDISLKIRSLSKLSMLFDNLVELALGSESFKDLRLVAELRRDMLGRIATASSSANMLSTGFVAPNTKEIGLLGGPTAIFEWVDCREGMAGLATFIAADGTVTESFQNPFWSEIYVHTLAERITQRLSVWHADRAGSPFDLKDWESFENWLVKELEGRLPEGGQLVVIEHEAVAGLQWHVAAAPRWRVSYTSSWSALFNKRLAAVPIEKGQIGLAFVPKYRESAANLRALENSVSRTARLAAELGLELKSALREACDRDTLIRVLEGSTIAKVLCHGFVNPDDDVVALMVAHLGELPLGNSVAANTLYGRQHRVDWRDLQQLKRAPAVIFSAACKSGQSHYAGLGEKMGLFSTLRRAGTRSVVAPRWDIIPEVVLPILDDAMERYLESDAELGEALHAACSKASEVLPRWQAWALALEGDWK